MNRFFNTTVGATYLGNGFSRFALWAPFAPRAAVRLLDPEKRTVMLKKAIAGYHIGDIESVPPGARYFFRLYRNCDPREGEDEFEDWPDPASRCQPEGVHGPSQVVSSSFQWKENQWRGMPLSSYLISEIHVGAYTAEGTFDALIPRLGQLKETGFTAIELMPVAQFPGDRNWGYDGVYPFAVQNSYGGTEGLKRLVDACHFHGLAVVLDTVYNHLGPEGNYLSKFGPYFTDFYKTPWGEALNFDGPGSDQVRRYFIENALFWISEFRIDALRLDAVHSIFDFSAYPFLEELSKWVRRAQEKLNRRIHLIAESALNDTRIVRSRKWGGFELHAQWNDDFHHCLHTILTGERSGYYVDFKGLEDFAKAWREGYVYSGQYSKYRGRRHGNSSGRIPARRFVVFSQNHDQIGNRMTGERLGELVSFEKLKLAAATVLLSPFIPLLFMGEEYGETAPFQYFVSHSDPDLVDAVRKGRAEEFSAFQWKGNPPDPQDESTFLRAKLDHDKKDFEPHRTLLAFHRELIRIRKRVESLALLSKKNMTVRTDEKNQIMFVCRWAEGDEVFCTFRFGEAPCDARLPLPEGSWEKLLDSWDEKWLGPGSMLPDFADPAENDLFTIPPDGLVMYFRKKAPFKQG